MSGGASGFFKTTRPIVLFTALTICPSACLTAAVLGTNSPALPLTMERISTLPSAKQKAWKQYVEQSQRHWEKDQVFFFRDMKKAGLTETVSPPQGPSGSSLNLHQTASWYSQPEALRIADIVLSFQTPSGGWSKNLDMSQHRRAPGERFSHDPASRYVTRFDNDFPRDKHWNYVGTFDNNATIVQLRYLAKVIGEAGPGPGAAYRTAFLKGMDYIFASQFPNGGWPQVWPLQGGYHDAVTFNDDAMIHVLELLSGVAKGEKEFAFVPKETRERAKASIQHGIECILAAQIVVNDHRTAWCQQHDALTLRPTSARNYEMPSQCGAESARITLFLMALPEPDPRVVAAVHSAIAWFEKVALHDVAFKAVSGEGRKLVPLPSTGPLWARYYEIGSDRPIFGDRDLTIHDDLNEISSERRNGYSWFNEGPRRALEQYAQWSKNHN